jgi:hypothetical protein
MTLLTGKQVATILGMSADWVRAHASGRRRPILPSVKLGKARRYEPDAVQSFIAAMRVQTEDEVRATARGRAA